MARLLAQCVLNGTGLSQNAISASQVKPIMVTTTTLPQGQMNQPGLWTPPVNLADLNMHQLNSLSQQIVALQSQTTSAGLNFDSGRSTMQKEPSMTPRESVENGIKLILHNSRQLGKKERMTLSSMLAPYCSNMPIDLGIAELVVWFMAVVVKMPLREQDNLLSDLFHFYPSLRSYDHSKI